MWFKPKMRFSAIFLGLGPLMDLILHVMIMQNVSKVLNVIKLLERVINYAWLAWFMQKRTKKMRSYAIFTIWGFTGPVVEIFQRKMKKSKISFDFFQMAQFAKLNGWNRNLSTFSLLFWRKMKTRLWSFCDFCSSDMSDMVYSDLYNQYSSTSSNQGAEKAH